MFFQTTGSLFRTDNQRDLFYALKIGVNTLQLKVDE